MLLTLELAIFHAAGISCADKVFEQGGELKLVEQDTAGFKIGLLRTHRLQIEVDRDVYIDRDQLFAAQHHTPIVQQRFALRLALHFFGMIERILHGSEALDQLNRSFVPDSGSAGDVVDRVSAQRHHINYLTGPDAEDLFHFRGIADQIIFGWIQHADAVAHELKHVLVARNNIHGISGSDRLVRQGADSVVSLKTRLFQYRNTVCIESPEDVWQLLR